MTTDKKWNRFTGGFGCMLSRVLARWSCSQEGQALMANSKAPKHDFAPAWLKVPDHESWVSCHLFSLQILKNSVQDMEWIS